MTRRKLREHAFCMLFRCEFYESEDFSEQVTLYMDDLTAGLDTGAQEEESAPEHITEQEAAYLEGKVRGAYAHLAEIDEAINSIAKGWKTVRMSKVDLTVIRLALYEMRYDDTVPEKVAINEAVELAKRYGGDDSPSFVNGILAKLVRENA